MTATIEELLTERYGVPSIVLGADLAEYCWNPENEPLRCRLYKSQGFGPPEKVGIRALQPVYGEALGGSLLLGALKLAMLAGPEVYGLYPIDELWAHPQVMEANRLDPEITFFMDAANVWFYGIKGENLYVYDCETDELDPLGPVDEAIRQLLQEWEEAIPE